MEGCGSEKGDVSAGRIVVIRFFWIPSVFPTFPIIVNGNVEPYQAGYEALNINLNALKTFID
ncbi:MAG: hypothetical protein GY866_36670 [Proteobacteria bacterium]|nr:hypothetical protein [Pseudomonadota bacterium]